MEVFDYVLWAAIGFVLLFGEAIIDWVSGG